MRVNIAFLRSVGLVWYTAAGTLNAAEEMDDIFDKSLVELASIPVAIATGTARPLAESAAVTTVITAEQIKSMGATELHEVLETVPGMHASVQGLSGDYNYSLRGIRNATNSQMLFLLNGTRITTPFRGTLMTGLEMPIEAIQQVEVIRGPGSALYGADAFAGVVNIITKKAKNLNGATVGGRVGDHDSQSGWGQYGTEWAGWEVATSLQYQHTGGDSGRVLKADAQTVLDNNPFIKTHASNAPGPLNTRLESLNAHLNLQRKYWDLGFWAFNADGGTRAGLAGALDPSGVADGEQYLGDVRFSTEDWFENVELLAHVSYLHNNVQTNVRFFPEGAKLPLDKDKNINTHPEAFAGFGFFPDGVRSRTSQVEDIPAMEFSAIYKGLNKHILRFIAGFRYESIAIDESKNYGAAAVNGKLTDVSGTGYAFLPGTQRTIWSYVVQDEWRLAEDWQLTAGLRYDEYSDFGGTLNPRAALVWSINPQLTSKLLYGKAFRAPTFTEQGNQNNPVLLGNRNLLPEIINTYEWAVDYHPFSSFRTAANIYFYQLDDHIDLLANKSNTGAQFQNNGDQKGVGTELEASWQVNEQWRLMGNFAWQQTRLNHGLINKAAGVPEQHIYFAAAWQFQPKWQLQPQINWIGNRQNPFLNNGPLDEYQTIDFTLRGKQVFGHLNLNASLRNAFDKTPYEPSAVEIGGNLPMPGRSFYLEAAINF